MREPAAPGSIVIDWDLIAAALTVGTPDTHRHPRPVQQVAHRASRAAIREGLRQSRGHDMWVVHSAPSLEALAEYQAHGARLITIDPGQDVVLARSSDERPTASHAAALRWYAQHATHPDSVSDTQRDLTMSNDHGSRDWGHPVMSRPRDSHRLIVFAPHTPWLPPTVTITITARD